MKKYIMAMSVSRHDARIKLENLSDVVQRHVIECVVYSGWHGTKNHWIAEISACMRKAGRIRCKSKLKKADYLETIFSLFGDELEDARWDLEVYKDSHVRKAQYPDFEIIDELVQTLFEVYNKFVSCSLEQLMKGVTLEEDWAIMLTEDVFN